MDTCLERRFNERVAALRTQDAQREALRASLADEALSAEQRNSIEAQLNSMDKETTNDYVLKALSYLMRYEEVRKGAVKPVEEFREQRQRNPALAFNKRRQRDFDLNNTQLTEFITIESGRRLRAIYDEYLQNVEHCKPSPSGSTVPVCEGCAGQLVINVRESALVCLQCGITRRDDTGCSDLSFYGSLPADQTSMRTRFPYLRVNHFTEAMKQFQGKETHEVPATVVAQVQHEVQRMHIPPDRIRPALVREILKRKRITKYYENSPQICKRIGGRPPPQFTQEMEERCRLMFWACQEPFEKHRPQRRTNWLSYNYTLMKIVELLGASQAVLEDFTLIKSREKLFEHDLIWSRICKDLGWSFFRTV
jgi:hypothetical protein